MREIPIKLGPLALLLTVISICMTTLAILTVTTARADMSLASTYAQTVQRRYELERQGQEWLSQLDGAGWTDLEQDGNGVYWKTLEEDGSRLIIGIDGEGRIVSWRQERDWVPDDSIGNIWDGF